MFLEIRNIKKSFGTGDSKVDVLKGLDLDIESRAQMVEVFLSKAKSWLI